MSIGENDHSIYIENTVKEKDALAVVNSILGADERHYYYDFSPITYVKNFGYEIDTLGYTKDDVANIAAQISSTLGVRVLCDWELADYQREFVTSGIDPFDDWFQNPKVAAA